MIGYSLRVVRANKAADMRHPGVKLGRMCIKRDVPITKVAAFCKVTRATVYSWFMGKTYPNNDHLRRMVMLAESLTENDE